MSHVHALTFVLEFPYGVAPGEGSDYNVLRIAKNGAGTPVLRGSSLAGVLRHFRRQVRGAQDRDAMLDNRLVCLAQLAVAATFGCQVDDH